MAEYVFELGETLYNEATGEVVLMPEVKEEIIRCKDCRHRDPEDKKCDCGNGIVWQLPRDDNWFCADGERRLKNELPTDD